MSNNNVSINNDPQHLLTNSNDPMSMNRLGRLYTRDNNLQALEVAAMNLATCDENKVASLRWWWNEGVRDYAKSEDHIKELNQNLLTAAEKLA